MRGRFLTLTIALAMLAMPVAAHGAESGINVAPHQTVDGPATARTLRVGWARLFVNWDTAEPRPGEYHEGYIDDLRGQVRGFKERGIKTLLVVSGTPGWAAGPRGPGLAPPGNPDDYRRFVAELVRRLPGVSAIEIWNEADESTFWAGAPDAAGYAALLRASYPRVKAADPGVVVVSTGMTANNYGWLSDVYAAGAGGSFDAVGVHTDTACLLTSPAAYYREPNGRVGRYSFTGYREVHEVMTANGDGGKRIWMTEIGWNTGSRRPNSCRDGAVAGKRAEGVSEKAQAKFLRLAYRCLAADPYVHVAMWFSLQDVGKGAGYGDHLGLIRPGGKRKRAFKAMRRVRNGRVKAARCGGRSDRVAPGLVVRAPVEGAVLTDGENMPVRVRARDNKGGVGMRRVELYVDDRRVRTWGGGRINSSWFGLRSIGYGDHAVRLRAVDAAGNAAERHLTIRKVTPASFGDGAAPRIRWRSLPRRAGARVRVAVEVTDRGPAGVRKATLYVDGRRLRSRRSAGLWRTRISLPGAGRHRVTLRAEDRAGNVARSKRYVTGR